MGASSPGEDLSWTPPSPGGSSEHALQKRDSDRWLFQTSSDADEHAEHSALSAISKRTQGEDYGQMDKSVIWRAVQSKG